ncbi:MAG: tRNA (adenosine(37)-N6)-threonylcarbamoyltransferase complex dimerization subunit type 1 TsaB [Syntrophus sp. (in: bacteria)]|nr:tRNA (adenosine(37)-N6)-threonylcarbamoyltransferase complex dimerization subunit type 1 TsaB [Syntrophus sp. (in: bacteria)]MBA4418410.1 tRNA (adenosine(37)-N6)-threonylcarbamoyltransferase complex dimerization subunit type 1 TsaB [Syntrophus sp. (in: bacteria)]
MTSTGSSILRGFLVESSLILGIDNSSDFLNIALSKGNALIEERQMKSEEPPSQALPGQVVDVLTSHGHKVADLSLIVVTLGPGSFTGIRVALAFAKGISAGKDIPMAGIPTLDALALPFSFMEGHYICPLVDAKKGEVFYALYQVSKGNMERLTDYKAIKPKDIMGVVKTPCLCFGTGALLCEEFLSPLENITIIKDGFTRVSMERLLKEGLKRTEEQQVQDLKPIYGRRSEAEIKFNVTVT